VVGLFNAGGGFGADLDPSEPLLPLDFPLDMPASRSTLALSSSRNSFILASRSWRARSSRRSFRVFRIQKKKTRPEHDRSSARINQAHQGTVEDSSIGTPSLGETCSKVTFLVGAVEGVPVAIGLALVGLEVGLVGIGVATALGLIEGVCEGASVCWTVGWLDGLAVGVSEGRPVVGACEGFEVTGDCEGLSVVGREVGAREGAQVSGGPGGQSPLSQAHGEFLHASSHTPFSSIIVEHSGAQLRICRMSWLGLPAMH
jgi:hypothetical protein